MRNFIGLVIILFFTITGAVAQFEDVDELLREDPKPVLNDYLASNDEDDAQIQKRSVHSGKATNKTGLTLTKILDILLSNYDKRVRPGYAVPKHLRKPVKVAISMGVSMVGSISEVNMDYTLDMYFRQSWRDSRLAFEKFIRGHEDKFDTSVSVTENMLTRIWCPDTFFVNAKKSMFHHATTRNAFLRIDSKGNVFHSLRLTVTGMCPMDLTYFPMDTQTCPLEIESFGYTTKDIQYSWMTPDAVSIDKGIRLPQYAIRGKKQRERLIIGSTGNYSRLICDFYFVRSMGYYLIQIYIPSILIVVLSWVSFWLSRAAVPARVALGITTVLTMTTLISSTNASLPKISYLKSIDVYLVTCFIMVFTALLEYAAVSYITKRAQMVAARKKAAAESAAANNSESGNDRTHLLTQDRGNSGAEVTGTRAAFKDISKRCDSLVDIRGSTIDKYSRVVFPLVFICFNTLYWSSYMSVSAKLIGAQIID